MAQSPRGSPAKGEASICSLQKTVVSQALDKIAKHLADNPDEALYASSLIAAGGLKTRKTKETADKSALLIPESNPGSGS